MLPSTPNAPGNRIVAAGVPFSPPQQSNGFSATLDGKLSPIVGLYKTLSNETNSGGFTNVPGHGLLGNTPLTTNPFGFNHSVSSPGAIPSKGLEEINGGVDLKKRNPYYVAGQDIEPKASTSAGWLRWLLVLLVIAAVAGLASWFLWKFKLKPSTSSSSSTDALMPSPTSASLKTSSGGPIACSDGFFLFKGKCMKCSADASWNGTSCVKDVLTQVKPLKENTEEAKTPEVRQIIPAQKIPQDKASSLISANFFERSVASAIAKPTKQLDADDCPDGYSLVDGRCAAIARARHLRRLQ